MSIIILRLVVLIINERCFVKQFLLLSFDVDEGTVPSSCFSPKNFPFLSSITVYSRSICSSKAGHILFSGVGGRVYVFVPSIKAAVVARLSKCCRLTPPGHCDSVSIVLEIFYAFILF